MTNENSKLYLIRNTDRGNKMDVFIRKKDVVQ
jgi:hypothetical protein